MPEAGQFNDKMAALRQRYLSHLVQYRDRLAMAQAGGAQDGDALGETDKTELLHVAHKLAGSGATYGFEEISCTAGALERLLHEAPEDMDALRTALGDTLAACDTALAG